MLTNSAATPDEYGHPNYFTVTANSGDVAPETSFGWDLGADKRFADTVLSLDLYQTTLHNQFLTTTTLSPTPYMNPPQSPFGGAAGPYPLYISQTANLGHSRYEGIELSLQHDPVAGYGFKLQGALQRDFVYDLPATFYSTATGPDTTNLAILPNENFMPSGDGYNGISYARVPYAQGYAEINYRFHNGAYFLAGLTYYGNNNQYNEPPFGILYASFRQPIGKHFSLLLAATNLTNAYSGLAPSIVGGIPIPLVNGKLGETNANVYGPSNISLTLHVDFLRPAGLFIHWMKPASPPPKKEQPHG